MKDLFGTIDKVRKRLNPNLKILGIIINQADGRKPVMEREMTEVLQEAYGDLLFDSRINKRVRIEESPAFQKPITEHDKRGPAAAEFEALVREIQRRLK